MKIKLNKSTYVMIAFMITTIGNSNFLTARGLDEIITYFGIGLLLYGIIENRYKQRCKNRKIHKETFRVFLIVEIFFSVGILAQNIGFTLKLKLLFTMFFVAAFALLSDDFIDSLEMARCAAYGVLWGIIVTTGLAIVGRNSLISLAVEGARSSGFNGGLQHKNYFACAMLAVFSVFYLCDKYKRKTKENKIIMAISAVLLILSNSRGALIMAFVFLVTSHCDALLKVKSRRQRGLFILFLCGIAVVGGILFYFFVVSNSMSYMIRMKGLLAYINIYKNDLFHMWFGNAEMAWENGDYVDNVRAVIGWDGTVELSFLSILVKNGILGYFGYATIFAHYIRKGIAIESWKMKSMILSLSLSLLSSALVENYITNTHVIYGIFNYCVIGGLIGQSAIDYSK